MSNEGTNSTSKHLLSPPSQSSNGKAKWERAMTKADEIAKNDAKESPTAQSANYVRTVHIPVRFRSEQYPDGASAGTTNSEICERCSVHGFKIENIEGVYLTNEELEDMKSWHWNDKRGRKRGNWNEKEGAAECVLLALEIADNGETVP